MRSLALALALAGTMACLAKTRGGKAPTWKAPWESGLSVPRPLRGLKPQPSDSLFAVFRKLEAADSAAASEKDSAIFQRAPDSLRVHQIFDTNFVFPPKPLAATPYAFDAAYRDDTLFRKAYGNGLFDQEHPCIETHVLSGDFPHPAKWLRSGLRKRDIVLNLGLPRMMDSCKIRYQWHSTPAEDKAWGDSLPRYEAVRLYFERDSLYAALLQRSKPCF